MQNTFKIKIFLWLVKKNRILTKTNIAKGGWPGSLDCPFCGLPESINHLFVIFAFISQIWIWIASFNNFNIFF